MTAYYNSNRFGIPNIESQAVEVSADAVTFVFLPHAQLSANFQGIIAVKLAQAIPTGTTSTLPIRFSTKGIANSAKDLRGHETPVTAGDIPGTGVYLCFFDREADILQLLSTTI